MTNLEVKVTYFERTWYDLGHIWPPLKISSNVVFFVSHLLNNTKLKNEDVTASTRKVTAIRFFHAFDHDFVKNLGGGGTFCPISRAKEVKSKP